MSDSIMDAAPQEEAAPEQTTEAPQAAREATPERFDFVLDKYRAEGRSESEALELQAKSYGELQSKFGAFTGAPDEYQLAISDQLTEAGLEIDADDPLIAKAMEFAKDSNMSQEGFQGMLELHGQYIMAMHQGTEEAKQAEIAALGDDGQKRIGAIQQWAEANIPPDLIDGFNNMAVNAEAFKAIEHLIGMTRNAPVANEATPVAQGDPAKVQAMQFELDANGNRRINTDPQFKAEYIKLRDQTFGLEQYRQQIG